MSHILETQFAYRDEKCVSPGGGINNFIAHVEAATLLQSISIVTCFVVPLYKSPFLRSPIIFHSYQFDALVNERSRLSSHILIHRFSGWLCFCCCYSWCCCCCYWPFLKSFLLNTHFKC